MVFESFSDLIFMDGHGGYVWFCYAVALISIVLLFWQPLAKKRQFMALQSAALRRQAAQNSAASTGDSNAPSA